MTPAVGRSLRVALLQLRAFELADHEAAWAELLRRIDEAAEPPGGEPAPQLIVAPEASYPAYYLHSRADYDAARVLPDARVEAMLAKRARRHGVALTVGLVQRWPDQALGSEDPRNADLRNVAVLFAPSGQVVARTAKRFLWHFDHAWFGAGEGSPVVEVGPARCGLFICADGRLPEIPRALAVAGAELLIDPTAWVSSGRDPAALSNPQVDYVLATRAIENGCWIVAADKVGTEAGTIVYAGRSSVVDANGRWRVQAPSDEAGVVRYTIDLNDAPTEVAAPPVARRPELYAGAAIAGAASRAATLVREPLPADAAIVRVAAAALDASPSAVELMERVRALARSVATQDGQLLVLPDLATADAHALSQRELLPLLEAVSAESGLMLAVTLAERAPQAATSEGGAETQGSYKTLYLLDGGALLGAYRQTHLDAAERRRVLAEGRASAGDRDTPRRDRPARRARRARAGARAWPETGRSGAPRVVRQPPPRRGRGRSARDRAHPRRGAAPLRSRLGGRGSRRRRVHRRAFGRHRVRVAVRRGDGRGGGRASRVRALAPHGAGHRPDPGASPGGVPGAVRRAGRGALGRALAPDLAALRTVRADQRVDLGGGLAARIAHAHHAHVLLTEQQPAA